MKIVLPTTPALRALCLFAFVFTTLFVLFHEPPGNGVAEIWDKAKHFVVYGGMAFMLWLALGKRHAVLAFVMVCAVGAADEAMQYYTPGRQADVWDWMTDGLGAGVCLVVARRLVL